MQTTSAIDTDIRCIAAHLHHFIYLVIGLVL